MQDDNQNSQGAQSDDAALRQGHEESLQAARELVEQVEQAEAAEDEPVPSQANADETAGTGI